MIKSFNATWEANQLAKPTRNYTLVSILLSPWHSASGWCRARAPRSRPSRHRPSNSHAAHTPALWSLIFELCLFSFHMNLRQTCRILSCRSENKTERFNEGSIKKFFKLMWHQEKLNELEEWGFFSEDISDISRFWLPPGPHFERELPGRMVKVAEGARWREHLVPSHRELPVPKVIFDLCSL